MKALPAETRDQLLPLDRSFYGLLLPYFAPYLIFVAISSIPEAMVPMETAQGINLLATGAALLYFRKIYRFGSLKPLHGLIALLALPVALSAWIVPFFGLKILGISDVITTVDGPSLSWLSFWLRVINSAILVAVFEELFMRVYVMGWFYQAGLQREAKGLIGSLSATLDQYPAALGALPLSTFSVIGTTLAFAAGHQIHEYLSAVFYFLFTTWLYKKTGSLWVCIIVLALTNIAITLLAKFGGMGWLW